MGQKKRLTPQQKELLRLYQRVYFATNETYQEMREGILERENDKDVQMFYMALSAIDIGPQIISGKPDRVQKNLMLKGYLILSCHKSMGGGDHWRWELTERGRSYENG